MLGGLLGAKKAKFILRCGFQKVTWCSGVLSEPSCILRERPWEGELGTWSHTPGGEGSRSFLASQFPLYPVGGSDLRLPSCGTRISFLVTSPSHRTPVGANKINAQSSLCSLEKSKALCWMTCLPVMALALPWAASTYRFTISPNKWEGAGEVWVKAFIFLQR